MWVGDSEERVCGRLGALRKREGGGRERDEDFYGQVREEYQACACGWKGLVWTARIRLDLVALSLCWRWNSLFTQGIPIPGYLSRDTHVDWSNSPRVFPIHKYNSDFILFKSILKNQF